jgi:tRNA pseudouridine55 synthase
MDAVINLDKPPGMTSFGAVARVRRLTGTRRVGHTGTLDPTATGVLPLCLGRATRFSRYMVATTKTYRATVTLGASTTSYDAEGEVVARGDATTVTREAVETALAAFRGSILQTPPMYSALKYGGQPLYRLARQGITVPREPRRIEVQRLELTNWQPPEFTLEIDCGKGFYVRSLAHDLGQALGCGAFLSGLSRLRVGHLQLATAHSLEALEDAAAKDDLSSLTLPVVTLVEGLAPLVLDDARVISLAQGNRVALETGEADPEASPYRVHNSTGKFIGVARLEEENLIRPERILATDVI